MEEIWALESTRPRLEFHRLVVVCVAQASFLASLSLSFLIYK